MSDYRLCDYCAGKAYYDSGVDYRDSSSTVLCGICSMFFEVQPLPKYEHRHLFQTENLIGTLFRKTYSHGMYSIDLDTGNIFSLQGREETLEGTFRANYVGFFPPIKKFVDITGLLTVISSDIEVEMNDPSNLNASFVIPSQENAAEYQSYVPTSIVKNVKEYINDPTAGPIAQLQGSIAVAQAILDNTGNVYNENGISLLSKVIYKLNAFLISTLEESVDGDHFRSVNGYIKVPRHLNSEDWESVKFALQKYLKYMILFSTQNLKLIGGNVVDMYYCYAIPISIGLFNTNNVKEIRELSQELLTIQFFGVLREAMNSENRVGKKKVYLMPVGGGVWNNPRNNIAKAVENALRMLVTQYDRKYILKKLDIIFLTYNQSPNEGRVFTTLFGDMVKK